MSLENYQLVLAKLYTDQSFRTAFYQNPEIIAQTYNLDENTTLELVQKHQKEIDFFSNSLIHKRWKTINRFFSNTQSLFSSESIFEQFQTYANQKTLQPDDRYAQDAFNFGKYLLKKLKLSHFEREVLIFEVFQIPLEKPYFRFKVFYYLRKNKETTPLKFQPSIFTQFHWKRWFWEYHLVT